MAYDINSIESLTFREGVRKRIQMYLGSDDIEGVYQALKEIINNSTDEALAGYGNRIEIEVNMNDNSIRVRDYGRGVPFGVREDGENVLVSIYTKSHTGGKFSNDSYKNASGLNGIGGSCVCLSSDSFRVVSYRDKKCARAFFHKGELVQYEEGNAPNVKSGTEVYFIPDPEVFSNGEINFSYERVCQDIKDISYLYNGITFVVRGIIDDEVEEQTFCAKSGIVDFVKDNIPKTLHKHIITASADNGEDSIEIAFQWGAKRETSYVFVNGLRCPEGGSPITGAKAAITKAFNSLANSKFDGDKIRENLFYVINCKVAAPSFANQTKSKINNASLRTLASTAFTDALKTMAKDYTNEFNTVVELLKKITKADEAAEKARNAILNHEREMAKTRKGKMLFSNKLNDAKTLGDDSILLVVEGDSAGGSMVKGRQKSRMDNIGVLKLRGKCINPFTNSIEDVLNNEEVKLLCQAIGITYGEKLNEKKLRYGKIGICVDADDDGAHIALLILSLITFLCPEYIKQNRMYWLRSPLYKIGMGKTARYYYSYEEFLNANYKGNEQIIRVKGLGQLEGEDFAMTMFNLENRRLEPIPYTEDGEELLLSLMGKEVAPRKDFIFNNIDFGGIKIG